MSGARLHVLATPGGRLGEQAAGELLALHLAAGGGAPGGEGEPFLPGDRVLLLGTSRDRAALRLLGLGSDGTDGVWLTPMPRGPLAGVVATGMIRRAARAVGESAAVVLWSETLRGLDGPLRRAGVDVRTPAFNAGKDRFDAAAAAGRLPAREAARRRLGLVDALAGLPALVPLSASPARVDARALAFVSGVLDLLGLDHALVVPDTARRFDEAMRFIRRTELTSRIVVAAPPLLAALPAADVLIRPAETDSEDPVASALTGLAGRLEIPVVTTAGWDLDAALGHGMLPPEIGPTVGPAVRAVEAARERMRGVTA